MPEEKEIGRAADRISKVLASKEIIEQAQAYKQYLCSCLLCPTP